MHKNSNIISPEKKSQILAALSMPGYSVNELSKVYNLSRTSIYALRRVSQSIAEIKESKRGNDFVELSVRDSMSATLEKASLTFNNFSFSIEGQVTSATLIAIVKILEEQSC